MQEIQNAQRKQLGQQRPSGTSPVSLYTLPTDPKGQAWVTSIIICNTTASPASWSLYNDTNGSTANESTALVFGKVLAANDYVILQFDDSIPLITLGATIKVQTSVANAITFTAYGLERTIY